MQKKLPHWHTVRGKLLILAVGTEMLMLTIMVANSLRLLHGAMTDQARWQAGQIAPVLNAAIVAPLAQQDYATVGAVIRESRAVGGISYIAVLDSKERRVAQDGITSSAPLPVPSSSLMSQRDGKVRRFDVVCPIVEHGQKLGTLHFGLDLSRIFFARKQLLTQGMVIAILELLLSSLIMLVMGYWLTRHLFELTRASIQVAEGNLTPDPVPEGIDDVGRLGAAFNAMSRAIAERVHELTDAKRALQERAQQLEILNKTLESKVQEEVGKNREKDKYLMHQEKMASIGQLAAGVAHEINNPMGFISSNLLTLEKYLQRLGAYLDAQDAALAAHASPEALGELQALRGRLKLDRIVEDAPLLIAESLEGGRRVQGIVQDLKTFSRLDQPETSRVNLNDCIDTTINIAWNEIKYVAALKKEYGDIPAVNCYPHQLNQVFLNMLVNASQAVQGHGEITVRTWQDGEDVFVSISDTGNGIPADVLPRIFEPFFTTKEVGKGTGLGLSISYEIVAKHNGEIRVESTPGCGTTFTIRLPIEMPAQEASPAP